METSLPITARMALICMSMPAPPTIRLTTPIVGNSMYLNGGLGIQLAGYVIGGNNGRLQNLPLLTDAIYQNGTLTVNGEFQGSGSGTLLWTSM